jgi:uncharacterized protein (DUF1330 family)
MVYVLAQMSIHDRERYDNYAARFMATLEGTSGRLLAADEAVRILEGEWNLDKVVLLEFADEGAYEAWVTSEAYQAIVGDRLAATDGNAVLIDAFRPPPGRAVQPLTCAECHFDYARVDHRIATDAIAEISSQVGALLADAVDVRSRREPDTWSPLEYACHLRDVFIVQRERMLLALREDGPVSVPMGRDERVEDDGYSSQAPADVVRQLTDAAAMFRNVAARLTPDAWGRTIVYNYPERVERDVRWLVVHTLHEARHHLLDIERQITR